MLRYRQIRLGKHYAVAGLALALLAGAGMTQSLPPETGRQLRVAGAQIPVTHDLNANLAALGRALQYAAAEKAEILLTPEGSLSGYSNNFDSARVAAGLEQITAAARKAGVALALGTCFHEEDGARYDELRFYSRQGDYLGFHAKILLSSRGDVGKYGVKPLRAFEMDGITVGGLVCNDLWANPESTPQDDPHLTRQLAGRGARVVFHAVNSGLDEGANLALVRQFHESNLRLRARASGLWIVVADAADPAGRRANRCPSGVIDPSGNWAVRIDEPGEHFFAYSLDLQ